MASFKLLGSGTELPPQIDRYELVAEIASGGMATVYLARLLGMGGFQRFFAIKRLHPHLGNDESFVEMFLDEARLVAAIRHNNVVPVLEVGAGRSGYYLVMEYIEGESFGGLLSRVTKEQKRIPPSASVRIVLDMLAGLEAAHELRDPDGRTLGVVHRDVSPQNILIDVDGMARISDFGVAHATSRLSSTRAGQLKGKVAYMAPEQARGQPVTRSADVFAAGIVLWEALCRKRLFMAENEAVTLNNLMFEPIPKLRQGNPTMPASLEKVLDKALERKEENRFATAQEFADAIESAARAARMLGTHVEVKNFVVSLMGEELSQRREALRDHLADIDRFKQEVSRPRADQAVVPPPTVPMPSQSVSSVSAAAMEIPAPPVQDTAPVTPEPTFDRDATKPPPRNLRVALLVAAVLSVGVLALAFMLIRKPSVSDAPSAAGSAPPSAVIASQPADAAASAAPETAASAEPAAPSSATASAAPGGKRPASGPRVPAATTAAPPAGDTAAPVNTGKGAPPSATDDLKHNPYR